MRAIQNIIFISSALVFTGAVHARDAVPMQQFENVKIITGSGKPVEPEAARKAILDAGDTGKRRWQVAQAPDGKNLIATTSWQDHAITVQIEVSGDTFSVRYADSVNLKYGMMDGKPVIHRNYNRLVADLVNAISGQLLKL